MSLSQQCPGKHPLSFKIRNKSNKRREPIFAAGSFSTQEVRASGDRPHQNSKVIQFNKGVAGPTSISVGLCELDIGNRTNLRVNAFVDAVTTAGFRINLTSWCDTTLYKCALNWLQLPSDNPVYRCGQFSTMDDHLWSRPQVYTSRRITFSPPFSKPPKVVVFLNSLDMQASQDCRVVARATGIDETGFTIHLDTEQGSTLYSARAGWIAYPANQEGIFCGTAGVSHPNQHKNSGKVEFGTVKFVKNPTVFVGINMLRVAHKANLRISTFVDSVSTTSMTWHIDTWGDTVLNGAGVSYICM